MSLSRFISGAAVFPGCLKDVVAGGRRTILGITVDTVFTVRGGACMPLSIFTPETTIQR